jgi:hypothetical protein
MSAAMVGPINYSLRFGWVGRSRCVSNAAIPGREQSETNREFNRDRGSMEFRVCAIEVGFYRLGQ